ncbi:MAG TPA: hypothetical protein VF765_13650 [Polyangiaceae bacterium]
MRSEVKGVWFVTAKRYLLEDYGPEMFEQYVAGVPETYRESVRDPVVSRWYPEDMMRDAMASFYAEVARGHDRVFTAAMERCAVLGIHWFLQLLVSVTTPRYLLRLVPAALAQLRRGPVRVHIDARDGGATLRFTGQPYADDLRYRLATPAIVRSLMSMCVGQSAKATLTSFDETTHVCDVSW